MGLDVHLKKCHVTVMDEHGQLLRQEKFSNEPEDLERILKSIDDAKVALEACYCWQPSTISSRAEDMSRAGSPDEDPYHREAKVKTERWIRKGRHTCSDRISCRTSHVPPKEIRELRELVRLRTYLVRERASSRSRYTPS